MTAPIAHLIDSSILGRMAEPGSPGHVQAMEALVTLQRRGDLLCITAQNLVEFWAFATRPASANGLEMLPSEARERLNRFRSLFLFLPDRPEVFDTWEDLVERYAVSGKPTHDARLVAVMRVYGIARLLTFNDRHFRRYRDLITPVHPATVRPD